MTHSLSVVVHKAEKLKDVEHLGKNDPYVQVTFNFADKNSFQKTTVKKNAGKHAEWDETLVLDNYTPNVQHTLYVEVLESDTGFDPPIAFAAVPLNQIPSTPGQPFRGLFNLYDPSGKEKGTTISLTLVTFATGQAVPNVSAPEVPGRSEKNPEHLKRIDNLKDREKAADVGIAAGILGGIIAAGAIHNAKDDAKNKAAGQKEV
ncbi:hypothetical protein BGZ72_005058 [Mortierella alpina]|nr:hypothetical protein BGZ72_005058 [Mortierella alpina]